MSFNSRKPTRVIGQNPNFCHPRPFTTLPFSNIRFYCFLARPHTLVAVFLVWFSSFAFFFFKVEHNTIKCTDLKYTDWLFCTYAYTCVSIT